MTNNTTAEMKHLSVYIKFIRQAVNTGHIQLLKLPRSDNLADTFTKQQSKQEFKTTLGKLQEPFFWQHKIYQSYSKQLKENNDPGIASE